MPKVSVIIPNYNHARYLKQRIDSVLNQSYTDFELIILDDNSTDNSRAIIDEYVKETPGIITCHSPANSGNPCKQWDRGVKLATGEYIWIAESDDAAECDFLQSTVPVLEDNRNIGMVYCNARILDDGHNSTVLLSECNQVIAANNLEQGYIDTGHDELSNDMYLHNIISNVSGVLFRKDIYIKAGWADSSMRYCGDWFFYCRILLISDIGYIARPLNIFRRHANSTFHEYYKSGRYVFEVMNIYWFLSTKIKLSLVKKLKMTKQILTIVVKNLLSSFCA